MDIFYPATAKMIGYESSDTVLDFGCGPGYLGKRLLGRVKKYCGIDTSARYIEECGAEFAAQCATGAFEFIKIGENYTDLSFLGDRRYSKVICLSVIQYYKNAEEVRTLISELKEHTLPGGKILIADIISEENIFADISAVLVSTYKRGKLIESLRFLVRALLSGYGKIRKSNGLLAMSNQTIDQIIQELGLRAELFTEQLTVNVNRKHLLIHVD